MPVVRPLRPTQAFAPDVLLAAQDVRAAIFDVDGCLTDGRIYIGEHGETEKAFSTLDGHGLKLLLQGGISPVVVTGRDSAAVRRRCADLGITEALFGVHDKLAAVQAVRQRLGLAWHQLAALGDDWPDLPLLTRVGFAAAPANAHVEVRAVVDHVSALAGGFGAAREFCDILLMANGSYAALLAAQQTSLDQGVDASAG
ncbi:MAG: HAD hydrolase family protein [Burkholderiales bacterium]